MTAVDLPANSNQRQGLEQDPPPAVQSPVAAGGASPAVVFTPEEWTPAEAAAYVTESYARSVQEVIETGRRLLEVKAGLRHGDWLPTVELLPFSESTARRLMQIAEHSALANQAHAHDLPSSWFTLYTLSQLPPSEVEARIAAREITPELERSKAEEWARVHQAAKQEAINGWTEAVDGLTRALSWAKSYHKPPAQLPKSHVQPDEFIDRLESLMEIAKEWK